VTATLGGRLPKRSQHHETQDDEIWVDWLPCAEGAVESLAPELGTQRPGDTTTPACFGYTLGATDSHTTADGKTFIIATYRKPKRMDADAAFSEVERIPGYGINNEKSGLRIFIAPDASAETSAAAYVPAYALWPGESSLFPRVVVNVRIKRNWRTGLARITVQYATLSQEDWLVNNIGKGLLLGCDIGGEPVRLNYDLADTPLPIVAEGWETSASSGAQSRIRWSLYSGSNVTLMGKGELIVRVALSNPWASPKMSLIGRYNASACIHIGNAQVKQLKMVGYHARLVPNTANVQICDFHLAFDTDGWDVGCKAIKETMTVRELPVQTNADTPADTLAKSRTGVWDRGANTPQNRVVAKSDSGLMYTIALIDGYLTW
jgi:hypothetical protein